MSLFLGQFEKKINSFASISKNSLNFITNFSKFPSLIISFENIIFFFENIFINL